MDERAALNAQQAETARALLALDAKDQKANPPIKTPIGDFPTVTRNVLGPDKIEKDENDQVIGKTATVLGSYQHATFFRPEETPVADKLNALFSMLVQAFTRNGVDVNVAKTNDPAPEPVTES